MFFMNRFVTHTDEQGYKRVPITLIFVQTRHSSDAIAIYLIQQGFRACALNSDRTMSTRLKAVKGIQQGDYDVVVGTDLLARGINISNVQNVINYNLPNSSPANYIHR